MAIKSADAPVFLTGIQVIEPRKGYLTLSIPPLEDWAKPMRWLTPEQQERTASPEFYESLQRAITLRRQTGTLHTH